MNKSNALKAVVILQAVCLIVLAVIVVVRIGPDSNRIAPSPASGEPPAASGGDGGANRSDDRKVASVGETVITQGMLRSELEKSYGDSVLRAMLVQEVLKLEAEAYGLEVTPEELQEELDDMMEGYGDEAAFFASMKEQLGMDRETVIADARQRLLLEKIAIRAVDIGDDDVEAYIRDNPEEFAPSVSLGLSWIVTESRAEAEKVLRMVEAGESFEALARTYSIDEYSADNGGSIGTVDASDPFIDEDMLQAVSGIEPGTIAGPVEVDMGWAVVRLDERTVVRTPDDRRLRDKVKKQLALAAADPLREVEDSLLAKYGAQVFQPR
ncbi:hypothetical protein BG53_03820 [Paenibacillus darwinianus]|uniref:PpiC domain-containing protein n=1 Tax=Paenibacillus darwinianus TaxID=1380763 RepID=A0A9W5W6T0_9BACL|nr:peptidylprolyl isomerase [Paenibacillus darwinianus]EXX86757.1 hypothetical protein BG52_05865 [Paenibacillus darwinianus]EXX87629.1 hypothetical protein BG53_03820 [Paenibacillus darwinianus]EXX87634.1 hypothetical protein CH50_05030 [Paenibacillus darwinianus]